MAENLTQGVDHVGLTVSDLEQACGFFIDLLGFEKVGEKRDYPAVFVSDGKVMITLWQVKNTRSYRRFSRHDTVGLHHLAIKVNDEDHLNVLYKRLEDEKIEIEFSPEPRGQSGKLHMMCMIPSGPRLEITTA